MIIIMAMSMTMATTMIMATADTTMIIMVMGAATIMSTIITMISPAMGWDCSIAARIRPARRSRA